MKERNLKVFSFEEAFCFSSLLDAHRKCRCNKGHKREIILFEQNLSQNLIGLSNAVLNGSYKIRSYRKFFVYEPKKREIESLSYKNRLVQYVLCKKILEPVLERKLIQTNCACRCSKGTGYARDVFEFYFHKLAKKFKNKAYFLKCDVSKYFASINHQILLEKLKKFDFETKTFNLIKLIIDSHNFSSGVGIPIGNQTSQWFALVYLNDLDHYIKERLRCKYYLRYMDDLIIMSDDVQNLRFCKEEVIKKGKILDLSFNKKTQISSFAEGVSFIGYYYKVDNKGKLCKFIKNKTKKRINDNLKRMSFFCRQNLLKKKLTEAKLTSYKNYYTGFYSKGLLGLLITKYEL